MTTTGASLLQGLSEFINDWESSTTTSAGNAGGTTLVDTYLSRYGDNRLVGMFIRITLAGSNQYIIRRITSNLQATGTVTVSPAFPAQVASSSTYELHRYDPAVKFRALDKARFDVVDNVFRLIYDDTVTSDGRSNVYDIPSTIDIGPISAIVENPIEPNGQWNFITNPQNDSTSGWTAASTTAATYARTESDLIVPKYNTTCTKLTTAASTAATYSQTIGNMTHGITAAIAADRNMTMAAWVYCTETSKIRLGIIDNNGTTFGNYHGGGGWELIFVERTIAGDNASTLTAQFSIANTLSPSTIYLNGTWFYFGGKERVADSIYQPEYAVEVRRDNATQQFMLKTVPPRGYQIRLIGKTVLTALGSTAATQVTNTMEVDNNTAEILYARASEVLFQWERVNTCLLYTSDAADE